MANLNTWIDSGGETLGFTWYTSHNTMGYRTGYIRVNRHHPWFLQGWDSEEVGRIDVHGGITWADKGLPFRRVPDFSYQWWIGFDCAHYNDGPDPALMSEEHKALMDKMERVMGRRSILLEGQIRDRAFVEFQCCCLCVQARDARD